MAEIRRDALFSKLNPLAYKAMESAAVFCKMRGNPNVELVHWLAQLVQVDDSDIRRIFLKFSIDASRLAADLTSALEKLPRGASNISDISGTLEYAVERSWTYATLMFGSLSVRSGHVLVALLKTRALKTELLRLSKEFDRISITTLTDDFADIVKDSPEDNVSATDAHVPNAVPGEASGAIQPAAMGKGQALAQFTTDLTAAARAGKIDPVVGRDAEIRQIIDILMRRRQNNPILTGEAGVGKTAVVEGFALRIARGDVPPSLRDVRLLTLDVGLLQAGASMKGEFENRLRQVIDEVQASQVPIILFIDEAHTLVGAGGAEGTGDAANLLKPALARGTLRTVAATTWAEYKKHIEKDPALTRRFQVVQVDEPTEDRALRMMRGITQSLEKHHRVLILDEAIEASVKLSHRYISGRQLPDKSVSLIDTAAARVAVSQHAVPAEMDDVAKEIEALETELAIIEREAAVGVDTVERKANVTAKLNVQRDKYAQLQVRFDKEHKLVEEILELRKQLQTHLVTGDSNDNGATAGVSSSGDPQHDAVPHSDGQAATDSTPSPTLPGPTNQPGGENTAGPASDGTQLSIAEASVSEAQVLEQLRAKQDELVKLQGEHPLILPSVDEAAVAAVVADWTGIPVGRMVRNEVETVLHLPELIGKRILGQDHALEMIARRVETSRAHLDNPNKPIGVFMLAGPSGVGKTETALALAETLYGGEHNMITINMSEFQEAHTVSTLKGSPPGYVGYGEGGVLTEAVRRKPYSVVLLDEIEKAHRDVHEIFFQVFDKGEMEDGEGRRINFRNTLILLTSNVGSEEISRACNGSIKPEPEQLAADLRPSLLKAFPAALLGRLVVIPYYPLDAQLIGRIAKLQLSRIAKRIEENYRVPLNYSDSVIDLITRRSTELESGGRMIDNLLTNTLLPVISRNLLELTLSGQQPASVSVEVDDDAFAIDVATHGSGEDVTKTTPMPVVLPTTDAQPVTVS